MPTDDPAPPGSAPSPDGRVRTANLPPRGGARLRVLLARALTRRCPYCGGRGIFKGWFTLRERCPSCGTVFEREEGYFLGAYAINLIVSEILGLGGALLLIFGTRLRDAPLIWQEALAVALALGLPLLFFPFSRTLWMALDLMVDPPGQKAERRLRGHEMTEPKRRGD